VDVPDQRLATFVAGMRLAGHDELEGPRGVDRAQPFEIGENEVRPLVAGHPAREGDHRQVGMQLDACPAPDFGDEIRLRLVVRRSDLVVGQRVGNRELLGVVPPAGAIRWKSRAIAGCVQVGTWTPLVTARIV
jgi:hypothetical protein